MANESGKSLQTTGNGQPAFPSLWRSMHDEIDRMMSGFFGPGFGRLPSRLFDFEPLPRLVDPRPFDILVANPPYIPTSQIDELDRSVRDYEPRLALDGGPDGLGAHRRILTGAAEHLIPGARLFLEIAFDQGEPARAMAGEHAEFENVRVIKDAAGKDRVLAMNKRP